MTKKSDKPSNNRSARYDAAYKALRMDMLADCVQLIADGYPANKVGAELARIHEISRQRVSVLLQEARAMVEAGEAEMPKPKRKRARKVQR